MQFKHPELLYALFLLLIPIIVHLFQLRKFQKEAFTNVAFLKEISLQTRKSSKLKKWLTLLTRLLLLAAIIIAFAQPFSVKKDSYNTKSETVIYLDNSFSMQAKGPQGELLKRAIQDIISNIAEDENISILTNDNAYKNTTIKAVKNDLLQLDYSSNSLNYEAVLLKGRKLFTNLSSPSLKKMVVISDFQEKEIAFNPKTDSLIDIHVVKLTPVNTNNISIDSAYVSKNTASNIELTVSLKNSGRFVENIPISLYDDDKLIAKTSVAIKTDTTTFFSLPNNKAINGKLVIDDALLQFDNSLFFNTNNISKINVTAINTKNVEDDFLKRIYTNDLFNYTSAFIDQLDYTILEQQNLIILNELNAIPNALISALKLFTSQGGNLILIPSKDISLNSYNTLLSNYNTTINNFTEVEKHVTTINYSHPIYSDDVFEKQVKNFQYPLVNGFYNLESNGASYILEYENKKPFLAQNNNVFIFTSPLNAYDSNFKKSPLIVPTLFNIGTNSFKTPKIYFTIGKENSFDVPVKLQQDAILSLVNNTTNIIPIQQSFNNKVVIYTAEAPSASGIYLVKNKDETVQSVSYNYNRDESRLVYQDLSSLNNIIIGNSVADVFESIKSDTKVNELWKWFVIFALAFLMIEMLILKYFK